MNLKLSGRCILRAWEPGELEYHLSHGLSLRQAMRQSVCKNEQASHNIIVLLGKELIADFLIGVAPGALSYCAIGTGVADPTPGDTILGTETYRQAWGTRTRYANGITLDALVMVAHCSIVIQEGGVFGGAATGAADSGTLYAHFLQYYDNTATPQDLTFEYQGTIG